MSDLQKQVQVLVDGLVDDGVEDGAQVAVYRNGDLVVNVVAGVADTAAGQPVRPDTLFYSASTGKAAASTVAHALVDDGVFDYDTRVADLWPEFAAHGKGEVRIRHVLTHSAGVPAVPADTTIEQLTDWNGMCQLIADMEPWWAPGERVGYHAATFGYLIGEVVRRATGKPISTVLAERVAGPIGMADELFFGVPQEQLGRVARLTDDPGGKAAFASMPPEFPLFKAVPPAIVPNADFGNRADVLTSDMPFAGTMSARAIAKMYAALIGEVDGVRLISPERLREATTLATAGLDDEMTGGTSTWALGYCLGWPGTSDPSDRPTVFGMVGIGGSAAFADRETGVTVAVTKNRFNPIEMNIVQRVTELADEAFV
ncbi:serine hydrolase domain-containing protein [Micromonospora sp. NPDC005171]|uniref:serine hydrolase domain-containing protein n=1 Tax=Micromonospora sp. NPDC005171 TaxID=3156866 RepID=UPI0033BBBF4C